MMSRIWVIGIGVALTISTSRCDYKPRNHGRVLYERHCQSCHMEKGQGLKGLYPPVANADFVVAQKEQLACIIRNGITTPVTVNGKLYDGMMAGNSQLTEAEISNLVHYLLKDLNQEEHVFEMIEIREQLANCKSEQ